MDHDVVVVGAGHNGLICAAYLARAGLDVLVLEARDSIGGLASTVDALGARINTCNCDHVLIRGTPVIEELELSDHGLRYIDLEPHMVALAWQGAKPWFMFHDVERTLESLAAVHQGQVEAYRRYLEQATPVAELLLAVTQVVPTPARIIRRVLERRGAGAVTLARWNRMSADAVLRSFFSDEALLGHALAMGPALWGLPPDAPRTGLGAVALALRHVVATGRPAGGSGRLPAAIAAALEAAGGRVRCGAPVEEILVEGNRVRGVMLASGETIEAKTVVSSVAPHRTLLGWVRDPPRGLAKALERWHARPEPPGYESKLDAIVSSLPRYRGLDEEAWRRRGVENVLAPTALVTPTAAGILAAHRLAAQGRVADRPLLWVNFPSVPDETMRPPNGHVFSLEVLFTPYDLHGGWGGSPEPERWLSAYAELVEPGFLESVQRWRVVTPRDYETEFGLSRGHAPSFAGGPLAALSGRNRELTRYRTSIRGLFLTGAGTYPGAGISGLSGRNTASVVLERS